MVLISQAFIISINKCNAWEAAKSVQDYSFGAGPIGNNKIKLGEELSPMDWALV